MAVWKENLTSPVIKLYFAALSVVNGIGSSRSLAVRVLTPMDGVIEYAGVMMLF